MANFPRPIGTRHDDSWEHCEKLLADALGDGKCDDELMGSPSGNDEENMLEFSTAGQLLESTPKPVPSGLGPVVDDMLGGGGFQHGEVVEIFGTAGIGKTQLALSIAAHISIEGCHVVYATSKDTPVVLACRLRDVVHARGIKNASELEGILQRVRFARVGDFVEFARLLSRIESSSAEEKEMEETSTGSLSQAGPTPSILIIDTVSSLMAPFASAIGSGHRWRLMWVWRELRRLSRIRGIRILMLSHTVGTAYGTGTSSRQALGISWASAATCRLELFEDATHASPSSKELTLALRSSSRRAAGLVTPLLLDESGVHGEELPPEAPAALNDGGPEFAIVPMEFNGARMVH